MFKLIAGLLLLAPGVIYAQGMAVIIDGESFRDPMQPPWAVLPDSNMTVRGQQSGPRLSSLRLSFVRSGGLTPIAVINDTQVTVGDEIEGVPVVAIRPGEVVLLIDGEEQVLSRFTQSVRTSVEN